MPIKSYLAHPHSGKKEAVISSISALEYCEVVPAKNEDVIIVITETISDDQEEQVEANLNNVEGIKLLAMVSGFNTPLK